MLQALERGLWRISVNWLSLDQILKAFKKTRQHWIYAVFAIVLGVLVHEGLFFLLPLLLFFYFRFPKFYWLFLLIFATSFTSLHLTTTASVIPDLSGEQEIYTAEIIRVRRRCEQRQTAIVLIDGHEVFMTFRDGYPRIVPGQTVEIFGRLSIPSEPTVPHRFNFQTFLRHQGIYLTIHTSQLKVVETHFSPWRFQYDLSDWMRERFPPLTASYLQSFFLGVRDDMDSETMDMFANLGLLQLFSISGVNVTLLTGIVKDALKRIGLIDIFVDAIVIIFCIAFVFMAGGSVSVVRACLMAVLAIVNRRFKVGLSSFDIFSLVFISNFILNPRVVFQGGFQFSYWISFVLICSRSSLKKLGSLQSRLAIVYLARMAAIPLSIASSYEVNLTAYISSLLISPLLITFIIPALLITLFLPFLAPLMDLMLQAFELINGFLEPILSWNLTFGTISLPIIMLLMACLLISCYLCEKHQNLLVRLGLIGIYLFVLEGNRLWQPYSVVTFLDVGQGDAAIIRSPYQSCNIVIDTGGDVSRVRSDNPSIFANTLEPYLLGNGVRHVDFLILTHEHYDHIAEAIPLMNRFNVRNLIISEAEVDRQMAAIIDEARRLNIPIHVARPLDRFTCGNQVYTFIHSEIDNLDVNEDSLVTTVEIDGFNVMITGDIGHVSEAAVLTNNHLPYIDIYQVAHHGSRYSNSLAFLDALNVGYAVVQVASRNFYGHPHVELFEVTHALGIPLLNSSVHGTIQFKLQRGDYQIYIWPHGD